MYYFRFDIPRHTNGDIVVYSEGWFGVMNRCPRNVTILLFDDRKAFGIAKCEDTFIPPEVKVLTEKEALELVAAANAKDELVFKGSKISERFVARMTEDVVGGEWMQEVLSGE